MDKAEAQEIGNEQLNVLRKKSYEQLCTLLKNPHSLEVTAASGKRYIVKLQAVWDSKPNLDLRVMALVDDGSLWGSIHPVCVDFIMTRDGSFVGE